MPYKIISTDHKFKVQNKDTGRTYSNKGMTKKNAIKQMRLLNMLMKH
jgi:hypothetical protein